MTDVSVQQEVSLESLVAQAADEFLERRKQGQEPDIEEYAARYPQAAALIRKALAALQLIGLPRVAGSPGAGGGAAVVVGGSLGDFRILREIGRGGMGVVYEAVQVSLGRHVALKVLPVEAARDAKLLARFRRESQAAAQLHHSNIVPVFEVGQQGDVCFYAMQYIQGQPLDQVIQELQRLRAGSEGTPCPDAAPAASAVAQSLLAGRFEPARSVDATLDYKPEASGESQPTTGQAADTPAVLPKQSQLSVVATDYRLYCRTVARIGHQVAEALAYAHSRGVVHRDIKPSNLLLDTAGLVWVSDFGLAKTQEQALTETGDLVGTVRYMAPERFGGVCDARADVYALGLTLYELLLLRPAFDAPDRLRLIDQIGHQEPARPRVVDPRIPRDLETILMKAIEKEPRQRYASAEALAEDLRRFLADEPILARRIRPLERLGRWGRRNPLVASLTATIVVVTALGFFGVLGQWQVALANEQKANDSAAQANQQRDEAKALADKLAAKEQQLQKTLYAAHMNLAQRAWETGRIGRVVELLEQHRPKPGETDHRGFEWHYLYKLCHPELFLFQGSAVAYSPDGKRLAIGTDESVRILDTQTNRELLSLKAIVWSVAFSPDSKRLAATTAEDTVKVWDAESGQQLHAFKGHDEKVWQVAFNPDGKRLASVGGYRKNVIVRDSQTGQEIFSIALPEPEHIESMAFSPDGKRLATEGKGRVIVWDAQTGQKLLALKGSPTYGVAFSPDGKRLASCGESEVKLWDVQSGEELPSLKGPKPRVRYVAFSPDGKRGASSSGDTVTVWDAQTGVELLSFNGNTRGAMRLAFSPDETRLASVGRDGTVRIWDVSTKQKPPTLSEAGVQVRSVAVSPDGKRVAGVTYDPMATENAIKLWDAQTGQEILSLKQPLAHRPFAVTISPDGKRLAVGFGTWDETKRQFVAGEVKVWDAQTGQEIVTFKGHTAAVVSLAFSPDSTRLASSSSQPNSFIRFGDPIEPGEVKVWNAATGEERLTLKGHKRYVDSVAYRPDGKRLATLSRDNTLKVWDAETGRELFSLPMRGARMVGSVAFSPDGKRLAATNNPPGGFIEREAGQIQLWDAQTGEELLTLQGHVGWVSRIAFSPDGKRLASGSGSPWASSELKLWDALTGEELLTFEKVGANGVAFSPDGHRLASAGGEGLKIFDATPLPEKP